jgi:alkylated DNA repair dioxygenase AlkB
MFVTRKAQTRIKGLNYLPNFVTPEQETRLLEAIDAHPWMDTLKRRVQHYGYIYDYRKRTIEKEMYLGGLPEWGQTLAEQFHREGCAPWVADQVIVNEYVPGQGIAAHIDCEPCFEDTVLSLTLGSGCIMDFTRVSDSHHVPLLLERCSLLVMSDESRYDWKHGIAARKSDVWQGKMLERGRRVSLTFRKVILV